MDTLNKTTQALIELLSVESTIAAKALLFETIALRKPHDPEDNHSSRPRSVSPSFFPDLFIKTEKVEFFHNDFNLR